MYRNKIRSWGQGRAAYSSESWGTYLTDIGPEFDMALSSPSGTDKCDPGFLQHHWVWASNSDVWIEQTWVEYPRACPQETTWGRRSLRWVKHWMVGTSFLGERVGTSNPVRIGARRCTEIPEVCAEQDTPLSAKSLSGSHMCKILGIHVTSTYLAPTSPL